MKEIEKRQLRKEKLKEIFFEMGMEERLIKRLVGTSHVRNKKEIVKDESEININISNSK